MGAKNVAPGYGFVFVKRFVRADLGGVGGQRIHPPLVPSSDYQGQIY